MNNIFNKLILVLGNCCFLLLYAFACSALSVNESSFLEEPEMSADVLEDAASQNNNEKTKENLEKKLEELQQECALVKMRLADENNDETEKEELEKRLAEIEQEIEILSKKISESIAESDIPLS